MSLINVMSIQNYIFGIDVDNTLTDTPPYNIDKMDLEETRKMIRNAPPKKGIEVLSRYLESQGEKIIGKKSSQIEKNKEDDKCYMCGW